MPAKHIVEEVLALVAKFVVGQQGAWEHEDWEKLVGQVAALGVELDDEHKRNLGNILEASKYFYHVLPAEPPAKAAAKPTPTPTTAPKAKPKAKA